VTIPLLILFLLWVHIMRISYRWLTQGAGLRWGLLLAMLALSLLKPALSQG